MKYIYLLILLLFNIGNATTATTSLPISAEVVAKCSFVNVTGFAFGNYYSMSSTQITVKCTNSSAWSIAASPGGNNKISDRRLRHTQYSYASIPYQMYTDAANTMIFGDGTTGVQISGTGTGSEQNINIYGKVWTGYNWPAGNYSDSITLTMTY